MQLKRPTLQTPLHVDWSWFERNGYDAESVVRAQLCYECHQRFAEGEAVDEVDFVDPDTGEVTRMDSLRETILAHCRWTPYYLSSDVPLIQGVLRLFLANNNQPLTAGEIAQRLGRYDPDAILRVLTTSGVKNGIVPLRS